MKKRMVTAFVALCLTPAASTAADRPIAAPQLYQPVPFVPRQAVEWTGLYFGANVGYGWARQSSTTLFDGDFQNGTTTLLGLGVTELSGTTVLGSGTFDGAIAGGQIGFNWQAGMVVFGAELDAQWSGQQGTLSASCGAGCSATGSVQIRSIMTGRARVGLAFDWFMPYLTAGAALVNARDDFSMTFGGVSATFQPLSHTQLGWTAGAGVEVALWSNWSAKLEYLYIAAEDLESDTRIPNAFGLGDALQSADYRDNIVRVGLNYRFGPRGGPGVLERSFAPASAYALNYDFLPSVAALPGTASVKRPAVAPTLAAADTQAPAPVSTEPKGKEMTETASRQGESRRVEPTQVEPRQAESKQAEPKGVRTASAIPYDFAAVGDIEDDAVALPAAPKPLKSSAGKRQETLEEESRRLKRIMSICAGC
jgi:outer membrane immunogenic protein